PLTAASRGDGSRDLFPCGSQCRTIPEGARVRLKIAQRSGQFFDLFQEGAENVHAAATLLRELIEDYRDVETKAQRIKDREHEGDEITHSIIRMLNTTFVTPMDREDIYALASALDDV